MPSFNIAASAAAALLACLVTTSAAAAASTDGTYAQKGAGSLTCEQFATERTARSNAYILFRGWLDGYVSHFNKVTPDTTDVMSWQTSDLIDALMNNFCKANPQTRFSVAADTLLGALYPSRLRNPSEVVEIAGSEPPIQLYKDIVRRIQQTLTERGFYKGAIDGAYGPGTATALKAFQSEKKLEATGIPDQRTLLTLFQ